MACTKCFTDQSKTVDLNINGTIYIFCLIKRINRYPAYFEATLTINQQLLQNQQKTVKVDHSGTTTFVEQPDFVHYFVFSRNNTKYEFNVIPSKWIYFEESLDSPPAKKRRIEIQSRKLSDDLTQLLSEEATKDFTFKVGEDSIKAHKLILSARSPVFKRMFETDMIENSGNSVEIKDASFEAIKAFLDFIYSDEYVDGTLTDELLHLADKYEVIGLKNATTNAFMDKLDASNAIDLLVLFDRYRLSVLKQELITFIAENKETAYSAEKKAELEKDYPILAASIESVTYAINP